MAVDDFVSAFVPDDLTQKTIRQKN